MRRWVRHFGLLLGLVATAAFAFYAIRTLKEQDLSRYLSWSSAIGIGIAAIGYSLIIPISSWAWRRILSDMSVDKGWGELSTIMAVTQLAKYIPGNIGQHVGRAAMSLGRGIPLRPYSISVVSEAVLAVIAATFVGVASCTLSGMSTAILEQHSALTMPTLIALACASALAIILAWHTIPRLLQRLTAREHKDGANVTLPRVRTIAYALIAYMANYAIFGIGITAMVLLLLPGQQAQWLLLTGSFSLAWVIGFFAPGAPAGLGVREGLMLALLQFSYNQPDALLIVIALRLATTAGDIFCFAAGSAALFLRRKGARTSSANHLIGNDHET